MNEMQKENWEELKNSVEMLEQILEVMPDDLFTLRALYETWLKLEDPEKAFEALNRLDDRTRAAQNIEMINFVLEQYQSVSDDSAEMQGRIGRLQEIKNVSGILQDVEPSLQVNKANPQSTGSRLDAEMALAWVLFQDDQLSQEEYSNVLHDLTEMSSQAVGVPVTVLHILYDRQFGRMERLMTHLCQKNDMPIIALSLFENNEEIIRQLPIDFISRNGVMPFAKVGDDLLVAVLNPLDQELLEEAQKLSGRNCHPCLVTPDEYDLQLGKIKQVEAG